MLDPDGDIELLVVSQGMTVYESFLEASPVATVSYFREKTSFSPHKTKEQHN